MRQSESTRVAVCVATLHRPVGLRALLDSLAGLDVPATVHLSVVVVDNDPAGSARPVVAEFTDTLPGELVYCVEERAGIPFARNRAVAAAKDADWVAFVDDDETVDPRWLVELLRVAQEFGADVVTGTVLPRFVEEPPAWVQGGRFFDRPRYATGTALHYARTSNALVGASVLTPTDRPFNESMALTGGSDTHFFQRVHLAGGTIVWADEAVVEESVPSSRVRVQWLLKREYRRGNTRSLCLRDLEDSPRRRAKRVLACAVHVGAGVGLVASGTVRGRAVTVRGLQRITFAAGQLSGLFGRAYQEYTVVHGA